MHVGDECVRWQLAIVSCFIVLADTGIDDLDPRLKLSSTKSLPV